MGVLKKRLNLVRREERKERQRGRRGKTTVCLEKLMRSQRADGKGDLITQKRNYWEVVAGQGDSIFWSKVWHGGLHSEPASQGFSGLETDRRKDMWEFEALLLDKGRSRRRDKSSTETGCSPSQSTSGCESKGFHHSNIASRSCKESPIPGSSLLLCCCPVFVIYCSFVEQKSKQ